MKFVMKVAIDIFMVFFKVLFYGCIKFKKLNKNEKVEKDEK